MSSKRGKDRATELKANSNKTGDFLAEVDDVREQIEGIKANVRLVESKHNDALIAVSTDVAKAATNEAEDAMLDITRSANGVKDRLSRLKAQASKSSGADGSIRQNQVDVLSKSFMQAMREYQDVQENFKLKFKKGVERQIKIVKPGVSRAEIERVIESGDLENIFQSESLQSQQGRQQLAARNAFMEAQEKNRELKNIEASIRELNQIFMDMAMLVDAQGEMLDSIEMNVESSVTYVEKGVGELKQARTYQERSRKKMCIIILVILVVLAVLLGPILGTQLTKA